MARTASRLACIHLTHPPSKLYVCDMNIRRGKVEGPDGTVVSFECVGQGPALVLTNGLTTTSTFWKYLKPLWAQRHTVVTWDLPGHGDSTPARTPWAATIEAQPTLLAQVMTAARVDQAVHIGFSMGSQLVLEMYRQHPERCTALVSLLGGAGNVLSTTRLPLEGSSLQWLMQRPDAVFSALYRLFVGVTGLPIVSHRTSRALGVVGARSKADDFREMADHLGRVHPATLRRMALSAEVHSVFDVLGKINVPLLIVSGDRDTFAPPELTGVRMQRAAKGSELVRLPGVTHFGMLEEPQRIADVIERVITRISADGRRLSTGDELSFAG